MQNLILYKPFFIEFEGKVIRQIYPVKRIDSPANFFTYESALSFNSWWTWQRKRDRRIAVKPICATKEQLYSTLGLTGEPPSLDVKSVQVQFFDNKLVLAEPVVEKYSAFSWCELDWDENLELAVEATKSSNPDAAISLLGLMQSISQDYYFASWLNGLEYSLWKILVDNDLGSISQEEIQLLSSLYKDCQGWWEWSDNTNQLSFLELADWQQKLICNK